MPWRWHPKMARGEKVKITPRLWRKSSQWFAMERSLAAVIVNDTDVADIFRTTCVDSYYDKELERCAVYPAAAKLLLHPVWPMLAARMGAVASCGAPFRHCASMHSSSACSPELEGLLVLGTLIKK
jgi:hypothetical protein